MKASAALAAVLTGLTTAAPHESRQDKQLARSCTTTVSAVQTVVEHPATNQPQLIVGHVRILARLGARDRAYHRRHPHGHRPPTVAFGVSFRYAPTG